jgi:hypothetical protein
MIITLGGLGIWVLVDLVLIACDEFRDSNGELIMFTEHGKSSGKQLLGISLLVIFLLIQIFTGSIVMKLMHLSTSASPQIEAVRDQLLAIRAGDLEKAYFYTSTEFRQETSFDTFKQFVENYPVIKYNDGGEFAAQKMPDTNDNIFEVVAKIHSNNGEELPLEYQLVSEDGAWKILGLRVDTPDEQTSADDTSNADKDKTAVTAAATPTKYLTYSDKAWHYSIQYPDNWYFEKTDEYSIIFSGKKGTPAYYSTVTLQVLPTKKAGGIYTGAKDIIADLKTQIKDKTVKPVYIRSGDAELPTNIKEYKGQYFEVSYTYKNTPMKKMQFVLMSPDGTKGYSWSYTASADRYQVDLPVAQAMYESWAIK